MAITFKKLRDGSWGLRATNHSRQRILPGARVSVTLRNGSERWVNVGTVVHRGPDALLATILPDEPGAVPDYIPPEVARVYAAAACDPICAVEAVLEVEAKYATTGPAHSGASVGLVIRSDRLSYHGPTRSFTAELSGLADLTDSPPDELAVESAVTGKLADFALNRVDLTPDREIAGWEYLCDALGLKLTIIND